MAPVQNGAVAATGRCVRLAPLLNAWQRRGAAAPEEAASGRRELLLERSLLGRLRLLMGLQRSWALQRPGEQRRLLRGPLLCRPFPYGQADNL